MEMEAAGAAIDLQMGEWKRDLDVMLRLADGLSGDAGTEAWNGIEELRRELFGLRIKKAATWHAPADQRSEAVARFDDEWNDWLLRAQALRAALAS